MNGELLELYERLKTDINAVDKSFIKLRTLTEEKWRQHDISAQDFKQTMLVKNQEFDMRLSTINETLNQLHGNMLTKPCVAHQTEMKWLVTSTKALWYAFGAIIVGGIVLGLWVKSIA